MTKKIVIREKLSMAKDAPVRPQPPPSPSKTDPMVGDGQWVVIGVVVVTGVLLFLALLAVNAG